ncbi:DUF4082 domain-containing protein [Jiangella endophytica]|uniref:DUF4082 domain-containing protein n=1 Tax=Jiangella endophytica TaxID=1623398 RepID=UPI0018E53883|nr:DUF4082 domain-containing protein [Jiangella endophytica]
MGNRIDFKIDTNARAYTIDIYRTGYYGGDGARKIASVTPSATLPQNQPQCMSDVTTELYDCGNWAVSASWNVPSNAVSGVYIAKLTRTDNRDTSHITFIVRNDASTSDIVFQTSDTTWHAYNAYGGSDFYRGAANGRAYKISYNRPFATRAGVEKRDFYFGAEYPMVRFLEQNGYDVSYIAGVDTDRRGNLLTNHDTFLSVGHDEYWSGRQRTNVEAARNAGVNLAFLSGNEMYWRTRWEPSIAGPATNYRTLVSYKETWGNAKIDPASEWTGTWRDPRFAPQSAGAGVPENAVTGTAYMVNYSDLPVTVSSAEGKLRMWRNTGLNTLPSGSKAELAPSTVGYESNEDLDNGFRPPGLIRMSTTVGPVTEYLQDFGNRVAPGTTTHHITLYKASSGALVFSAGSVQWTWGLDAVHDGNGPPADRRMRQATVNLLADMNAQPVTLDPTLTAATKSTDTTAPTATITAPAAGAQLGNGSTVTVSGTAADVGGVVAGVEVSTDGGATWHPANGTTSWSYSYLQHGAGAGDLRARAIDDSANIGAATTRAVQVGCPCSIFGTTTPPIPSTDDGSAVELGLRFTPTTDGYVTGVRFYKGQGNTGTHVGTLWSSTGASMGSVTFTNESASGWQIARFPRPVAVTAGQTYVVSYLAPAGRYASAPYAFSSRSLEAAPLRVAGGFGAAPGGVFGVPGTFPQESWNNTNYFVDVEFALVDNSPLTVFNQSPLAGANSVPQNATITAAFSKNVTASSVAVRVEDSLGNRVAGSTSYNAATRTVSFDPTADLQGFVNYTVTVTANEAVAEGGTWSFRTARPPSAPGACPCTLFDEVDVPGVLEINDPDPVTLGVRFSSTRDGVVTGVRFYKGPNNTGTHVGSLWGPDGAQLGSVTFTNESGSGWQEATFAQPIPIVKDAQYTVAYRAPNGRYSATLNAFTSQGVNRPPLSAPVRAGAYTYTTGFPKESWTSNYMVDVVFEAVPTVPTVTQQVPANASVGVPTDTNVGVTYTAPLDTTGTLTVTPAGGSAVAGTTTRSADGLTVTFDPTSALVAGTTYTARHSGARTVEGATVPAATWTFTTAAADGSCPCTLFGSAVPTTPSAPDSAPVELGTAFTPSRDGQVTAVRFYKGQGNTGTHTGSLWNSAGERIAQVTFTNETAVGWQTATFAQPVNVQAGTTYIVSYFAPRGRYAADGGFFVNPRTQGPLTAPATDNGRYRYDGGFPQFSYDRTNYYVDVVFMPSAMMVTGKTPADGATAVAVTTTVRGVLDASITGSPTMALSGPGGAIAGQSSYASGTRTVTFTPSAALPYQTELTAVISVGGTAVRDGTWKFTTAAAPPGADGCPCSIWSATDTPASANWNDPDAVQVGVRVTPAANGVITGIRFYKGPQNTGTHTGYLWSSSGQKLGEATFTGETASGWQTVQFATPVPVTAGQTYTASYYTSVGRYAVSSSGLATSITRGPLTVPANGGAYVYGTGFPSGTAAHNYWVDVIYRSGS